MLTLTDTPTSPLAQLLAPSDIPTVWNASDLAAILRHQLAAPLLYDLPRQPDWSPEALARWAQAASVVTFRDLFSHPHPPLPLLEAIKQFAKTSPLSEDQPVPPQIATVLYFASIVIAVERCGQRISTLTDKALHAGVAWALAQDWIDPQTHALFRAALPHLPGPSC